MTHDEILGQLSQRWEQGYEMSAFVVAERYGVSRRTAQRLIVQVTGDERRCPRCHVPFMAQCGLAWCPQCAWEPAESQCRPAKPPPRLVEFVCEECGEGFGSKSALGGHTNAHKLPDRTPQACPECGRMFPTGQSMSHHVNWHRHPTPHGSPGMYRKGCRCGLCKAAAAAYRRDYEARKRAERDVA